MRIRGLVRLARFLPEDSPYLAMVRADSRLPDIRPRVCTTWHSQSPAWDCQIGRGSVDIYAGDRLSRIQPFSRRWDMPFQRCLQVSKTVGPGQGSLAWLIVLTILNAAVFGHFSVQPDGMTRKWSLDYHIYSKATRNVHSPGNNLRGDRIQTRDLISLRTTQFLARSEIGYASFRPVDRLTGCSTCGFM